MKYVIFISFIFISLPFLVNADSALLLEDPKEAWQSRIDLIEQAQSTIEVEYYAIAPDTAGEVFTGLLFEAAERGVKVRILVGGLTHATISDEMIGVLIGHPNIEIRFYHSLKKWYKPSHWIKHLHDKIILVDDRYLITGGRNIADKYFDMTPSDKQQTIDRDILIVGDKNEENIPIEVKSYFNKFWDSDGVDLTPTELYIKEKCIGSIRFLYSDILPCQYNKRRLFKEVPIKKKELFEFLEKYKKENANQFNTGLRWEKKAKQVNSIKFFHDPIDENKSFENGTALALAEELRNAKKSILYFTPYIIKTDDYFKTAEIAKEKGVKQVVLTNSAYSGANAFGIAGTEFYYNDFNKRGLEYWAYQGFHSMHHKTYLIDDNITVFSTYNYDPRSQNLNTEMLYVIDDKNFFKEVEDANKKFFTNALMLDEKGNAIKIEGVNEREIPLVKRVIVLFLKIVMPIIRWAL